jgi:alpha-glucoside transport system substrate-binding protein
MTSRILPAHIFWEDISMKTRFFTSVAALALVAGTAQAQDLCSRGRGRFQLGQLPGLCRCRAGPQWPDRDRRGPLAVAEAERFDALAWPISRPRPAPTATYSGSDSFEQQIVIDAEAGSPPNIAVFPQPGLPPTWPRAVF